MEIAKKTNQMDLVDGSTREMIKKMILFTLPIIAIGLLELLYTAFDLIVVQSFEGSKSAAAVGANNSLISLITSGFMGLSNGVNVVIARCYGKNDKEKCERALHTALMVALIGGIAIGIFGALMAKNFLTWMRVDSSYIDLANQYLSIYFIGLPVLAIYNFGCAILRGTGNSTTPLIFLFIAGLINVGMNYLFVYVFHFSVAGVAWATVISESISALLVMLYLYYNHGFAVFRFKKFRIDRTCLNEILRIGIPSGIQGVVFSISNVILQSSVNTWGPEVVAANSDASSIEGFTFVSIFAVTSTASAFTSANYGRGFKHNIKKIQITTIIMTIVIGLVFGLTTLAFSRQLLGIYMGNNVDPNVQSYAIQRLVVILTTYSLCGLMDTECGTLRGLGYSISPLIITICFNCLFRVFWDFFVYSDDITSPMHSLGVLYACYPISWALAFSAEMVVYFVNKKKINAKIDENLAKYEEINNITLKQA